jgi:hypothetical protein
MKFIAIVALLFVVWHSLSTVATVERAALAHNSAVCHTDTECMKLCLASDRGCDGGPEGVR